MPQEETVTESTVDETAAPAAVATAAAPKAAKAAAIEVAGEAETRKNRKTREGLVVSDKMDKTVVVAVEDRVQHPLYKKDRKSVV